MIDIRSIRSDIDGVKAALGRRGVDAATIDEIAAADEEQRLLAAERDTARNRIKDLSQ